MGDDREDNYYAPSFVYTVCNMTLREFHLLRYGTQLEFGPDLPVKTSPKPGISILVVVFIVLNWQK